VDRVDINHSLGTQPQGGSSECDENSENLYVTDGLIEVDVQSYGLPIDQLGIYLL
jgi:hypothetical protein